MKLTPLDIRTHEFTRKVRGYDPEEVKAFTDMVSRQWEEALDDLRHANDRVRELEGKIEHYEKVESALHEALQSARNGAKRTQEQAEEKARLIVEEAELRAEQHLQEVDQRQHQLQADVTDLARRRDEIVARLRHFLMSELEILARHDEDRPIGFMQLMPSEPAEALPAAPEASNTAEASESGPSAGNGAEQADSKSAEAPADSGTSIGTTYGDLYARAAESESEREASAEESNEAEAEDEPEEEQEPTWTLRSIVGGGDEDDESYKDKTKDMRKKIEAEASAPDSEKERIRRILEDLD